ncbi:cortical patch protein [Rhizodiscina lignyota]|uniref:Cortical patch protein n=1 Tax=Rhizodiscina lignyota TaxID=1504668 RepID=A0A9P4MC70_9PEZI|nr:cortical patch protein [Rhizodiscina lignyota]
MAVQTHLSLVSWILVAGAIVLQFLVILSGGTNGSPEDQIYFLQTSTNGIPGAPNPARWTFFAICGVNSNGHNTNCRHVVPALPFDPPHHNDFGTTTGVPHQFIGTNRYYYLSRFMFAFYLIALFFAVMALLTGFLAMCARLGAYVSALSTAVACFFQAITASLMTAWTIQGRDVFRSAGQSSKLGVKAYAFTWAAMACLFLSTILYCLAGASNRSTNDAYGYSTGTRGTRGGFFSRNRRSVRSARSQKSGVSRGSFLDSERDRLGGRVKDDYS